MKNLLTVCLALCLSGLCTKTNAQSFASLTDTIFITTAPVVSMHSDSIITGSSPVNYVWKVIDCNFPADWVPLSAFCQSTFCYALTSLWPSGYRDTTASYAATDTGVVYLALDLMTATSVGCYYVTARFYNESIPSDSTTVTWAVCLPSTLRSQGLKSGDDVTLYPNPVNDVLSISYGLSKGVAGGEVYDMLGHATAIQTNANGATIDMHGLSGGVYFLHLYNNKGDVIASRKFVKN